MIPFYLPGASEFERTGWAKAELRSRVSAYRMAGITVTTVDLSAWRSEINAKWSV